VKKKPTEKPRAAICLVKVDRNGNKIGTKCLFMDSKEAEELLREAGGLDEGESLE
jgi:hypothetical protein